MTHPIPSRTHRRALMTLVAASLLLAACGTSGGGDDAAPTTTEAAPAEATTTTSQADQPDEPEEPADDTGESGSDGESDEAVAMTFGDDLFVADLDDPDAFPANAAAELTVGDGSVVVDLPASDTVSLGATGGSSFYEQAIHVTTLADTVDVESPVNGTWGVHCRGEDGNGYIGAITQATSDPNQYNWSIVRIGDDGATVLAGGDDAAWVTSPGGSVRIGLSCNATSSGQVLDLLVGEEWVGQVVDPGTSLDGAFTGIFAQTSDASGGSLRFSDLRVIELVPA